MEVSYLKIVMELIPCNISDQASLQETSDNSTAGSAKIWLLPGLGQELQPPESL